MTAGPLFQPLLAVPDTDPFGPEPPPIPAGAPVGLDGMAALLRSGFGGRQLRACLLVPGQPAAPLTLCCTTGGWTLIHSAGGHAAAVIPALAPSDLEGATR